MGRACLLMLCECPGGAKSPFASAPALEHGYGGWYKRMQHRRKEEGGMAGWLKCQTNGTHAGTDSWASGQTRGLHVPTVSYKTIPITNPNTVREAHCNHTWEFRLALVWPNKVQTLGYKPVLGACDLAQRRWRYIHFKSPVSYWNSFVAHCIGRDQTC